MASMQIISGATGAGASKGAKSGAMDPVMAGFSADAAATAGADGQAGSGENPFSAELSAALAALESGQSDALSAGADQNTDAQMLDPAALAAGIQASGQNLPLDPSFQNAVLATFAVINGAVQGTITADAADANSEFAMTAAGTANVASAVDVMAAQQIVNQAASAASNTAETPITTAVATQALNQPNVGIQNNTPVEVQTTAAVVVSQSQEVQQVVQQAGLIDESNTDAQAVKVINANAADLTKAAKEVSTTVSSTAVAAANASQHGANHQAGFSGDDSGADAQNAAEAAARLADAARPRVQNETGDQADAQAIANANQATDAGNGVVAITSNANTISAAAESVRQSGPRVDAASAAQSAQSAQFSDAARAESKLEAARASLGSGPLNVEVLKLTRQGGGRAVIEVTPPNQGPIRLDLQLDGSGRANLVVEGLTDSMKARLESSAHFLRQDMASMGLALNLEMRERNDSNPMAQMFDQNASGNSSRDGQQSSSGSDRATVSGVANGSASGARSISTADDGIHLVA